MARSTRETILTATAELMRHRGYGAVGMKDIVAAAGTPIGSLYHHFPGGKAQIAHEALTNAGAAYGLLLFSVVDEHTDLGDAIAAVFTEAAADMADDRLRQYVPGRQRRSRGGRHRRVAARDVRGCVHGLDRRRDSLLRRPRAYLSRPRGMSQWR